MPVKLDSKMTPENEARIEVIPLIDIMFFLLASFMLVSLSMVNLHRINVNLPTATTADTTIKNDLVTIAVDKSGVIFLDKKPVGAIELSDALKTRQPANQAVRVLISGDADTRHGDIIRALDIVRAAGVQNVSFEIRPQ